MAMVSVAPEVQLTGKYSSAETAKLLGVHRNSIINYTRAGLLKYGIRKSNGRKFFRGVDILYFWRSEKSKV